MPLVWCLGSIVGPMIGGTLARPCISYPDLFPRGTIFDQFPYLLPNLFSAGAVLLGVIIGILFLDETHAEKKHRRDPGRELGKALVSGVRRLGDLLPISACKRIEKQSLLLSADDDEQLPSYSTMDTETSDLTTMAVAVADPQDPLGIAEEVLPKEPAVPVKVFTRLVILNIVEYGILAL